MRVLVTGAYGFIGSHIVAALVAADHDVVCAVRGARLDSRFPGLRAVACDMSRDVTPRGMVATPGRHRCGGQLRRHLA